MMQTVQRIRAGVRKLGALSVTQIEAAFGHWIRLPDDFGRPARHRLFSPHTHLLAFSLSGPHIRCIL